MLARGDSWLRQQMAMDDILASAAEIDPGLRTQPVNLDERGWQQKPAVEARRLASEQQGGFRRDWL